MNLSWSLSARGSSNLRSWNWLSEAVLPAARYLRKVVAVKIILENLLALQNVELVRGKATQERDAQILSLRDKIPQRLLAHYDSLMANGRKGVALVRDGLCSECRQLVGASALNGFLHDDPIQICIHCRRFLYWSEPEADGTPAAARRTHPASRRRNPPARV